MHVVPVLPSQRCTRWLTPELRARKACNGDQAETAGVPSSLADHYTGCVFVHQGALLRSRVRCDRADCTTRHARARAQQNMDLSPACEPEHRGGDQQRAVQSKAEMRALKEQRKAQRQRQPDSAAPAATPGAAHLPAGLAPPTKTEPDLPAGFF